MPKKTKETKKREFLVNVKTTHIETWLVPAKDVEDALEVANMGGDYFLSDDELTDWEAQSAQENK